MSNKVRKTKVQQFICHDIVEGMSWKDADKVLKVLMQRSLEQFDNWCQSKTGSYKILAYQGPGSQFGQLKDISNDWRGIVTLQIVYQE